MFYTLLILSRPRNAVASKDAPERSLPALRALILSLSKDDTALRAALRRLLQRATQAGASSRLQTLKR